MTRAPLAMVRAVPVRPPASWRLRPARPPAGRTTQLGDLSLASIQQLAAQIASGAMSISDLGTLASQDLQLVQGQVAAIQAGQIPAGGISVFIANNKVLVYGSAALVGAILLKKLVFD